MKKGITPVIAIILLLMVTIAMIGFAFIWFSGIMGTITNTTGTQMTEEQRQMAINVVFLEAYSTFNTTGQDKYNITTSFRNSGTQTIKADELVITIQDTTADSRLDSYTYPNAIAASESVMGLDLVVNCEVNHTIELTASLPGPNGDVTTFTC